MNPSYVKLVHELRTIQNKKNPSRADHTRAMQLGRLIDGMTEKFMKQIIAAEEAAKKQAELFVG
jgi:hypothetical protein